AQQHRHQEPGDRCADREGDLRDGSAEPGSRDARARPRAAVEQLRRAAIYLPVRALRPLGPLQPRRPAEICPFGAAVIVVVRCREGCPDRQALVKELLRMAAFSRRHFLGVGAGALAALRLSPSHAADEAAGAEIHGISAFGDLKYPADFKNFDYVNVAAPKGGLFSTIPSSRGYNQSFQTFNSLNAFILKGEGAQGMDLTFSALMVRAGDEPDAMYGLVAKSVR